MDHIPNVSVKTDSHWKIVLPYALIYFFVSLSDAIMSYASPVYVESRVGSPALMGLVISSSSVVGIACDFLFAKYFKNRRFVFFLWSAVICALLFPASFYFFPPAILIFLFGMAIWGIYYELLIFSDFNFIKQTLHHQQYSSGWGILNAFKATAYFLGPLLAAYLTITDFRPAFAAAIGFTLVSIFILALYSFRLPKKHLVPENDPVPAKSFSTWTAEFKIWFILIRKIWPVYIFITLLFLIDSAFWTIGTLISENLMKTSPLGGLFLPAYSLPTLFMGLIIGRIFPPTGKKHLSFITAIFAGLLLSLVGFISIPILLLITVFVASLLLSVTFPEIFAVFEDYVSRLGNFGSDMIGLEGSASSLAYIIGPILAGTVSSLIGNQLTFTVFGLILAFYSAFALMVTPRKIHLPQQELQNSI